MRSTIRERILRPRGFLGGDRGCRDDGQSGHGFVLHDSVVVVGALLRKPPRAEQQSHRALATCFVATMPSAICWPRRTSARCIAATSAS